MALLKRRRAICLRILAFALVPTLTGTGATGQPVEVPAGHVEEYRVKGAILYNLAKFVEWPAAAFSGAGSPFSVCILGADPFGPELDDMLLGKSIGGHPIAVRRVSDVVKGCHLMFIAGTEQKRVPVIAERLRGLSVLTVGEDETFLTQGGIIRLSTDGDRVRFAINSEAAERAQLKVSARLLVLASPVHNVAGVVR